MSDICDKSETENKSIQDDYDFNEILVQNDEMHTICKQNTTQCPTRGLDVENENTCKVIEEKAIPVKVHIKPVQTQYKPLTTVQEKNTTNETVKINIEDDDGTAVETDKEVLKNKNLAKETASIKNKLEPTVRKERIGEWVFMYQQPQPYYPYPPPQYPPPQYPPPQYPPVNYGQRNDDDDDDSSDSSLYDGENRNAFVRKVFSIIAVMLIFTVAYIAVSYKVHDIRSFLKRSPFALFICIFAMICNIGVSYIYYCSKCANQVPINFLLNMIATFSMSYIGAFCAAKYAPFVVLGAAVATLAVTLLCLGLAYTSFDFTKCILIVIIAMFACFIASMMVGVLTMVLKIKLTMLRLILLVVSSIISSVMLIIEFQMILGGKSAEIDKTDYTFAAFLVYESIISIFIKMMGIIGISTGDGDT